MEALGEDHWYQPETPALGQQEAEELYEPGGHTPRQPPLAQPTAAAAAISPSCGTRTSSMRQSRSTSVIISLTGTGAASASKALVANEPIVHRMMSGKCP